MANEAVLQIETELPIPFTCANATGIEKGTFVKLADPATVSAIAVGSEGDIVGGITAEEKIASDGKVKVPVYRGGIFKVLASGDISVGDPLQTDDGNYVFSALTTDKLSGSKVVGIALETAADDETFLMELRPQIISNFLT